MVRRRNSQSCDLTQFRHYGGGQSSAFCRIRPRADLIQKDQRIAADSVENLWPSISQRPAAERGTYVCQAADVSTEGGETLLETLAVANVREDFIKPLHMDFDADTCRICLNGNVESRLGHQDAESQGLHRSCFTASIGTCQ